MSKKITISLLYWIAAYLTSNNLITNTKDIFVIFFFFLFFCIIFSFLSSEAFRAAAKEVWILTESFFRTGMRAVVGRLRQLTKWRFKNNAYKKMQQITNTRITEDSSQDSHTFRILWGEWLQGEWAGLGNISFV